MPSPTSTTLDDTNVVHERHELTIFSDAKVWVEIDAQGNAAIFFRHHDNNQSGTVSFDANNWAEVKAFWDRVTQVSDA